MMLNWSIVRYKVKADRAAENEEYIHNVFEQLRQTQPSGLTYASFKLEDGVSFMHIVGVEADTANPLMASPAFREFTATVRDRCDELPVAAPLSNIGAYAWAGERSN